VDTDIQPSGHDLRSVLDEQRRQKQQRQLEEAMWARGEENKMVVHDLQQVKRTLYDQSEKKQLARDELVFHNSILRQTRMAKDQEEENWRRKQPPEYWPFVDGEL